MPFLFIKSFLKSSIIVPEDIIFLKTGFTYNNKRLNRLFKYTNQIHLGIFCKTHRNHISIHCQNNTNKCEKMIYINKMK